MSLKSTIFDRVRKCLRVVLGANTAGVTPGDALGDPPLNYTDSFINTNVRHHVNGWFADLGVTMGPNAWDATSTLGDVSDDVIADAGLADMAAYRKGVTAATHLALDHEVGASANAVPVADRPLVRDDLNGALRTVLLTDVTLDDLKGSRAEIVAALVGRMLS
jgi:hypothetical protein